jgi:PilZ domain
MVDQRTGIRKDTSLNGRILLDGGTAMPCVLANVSATGAKISLPRPAELPDTFHLQADDLDLDVQAEIVWHREEQLGVRFLRRPVA